MENICKKPPNKSDWIQLRHVNLCFGQVLTATWGSLIFAKLSVVCSSQCLLSDRNGTMYLIRNFAISSVTYILIRTRIYYSYFSWFVYVTSVLYTDIWILNLCVLENNAIVFFNPLTKTIATKKKDVVRWLNSYTYNRFLENKLLY